MSFLKLDMQELLEGNLATNYEEQRRFQNEINKPVVIYGAGYLGRLYLRWCQFYHIPVAAVCDKNLAGQVVPGIGEVRVFKEVADELQYYQVIIASVEYREEIERDIREIVPDCEAFYFTFPLTTSLGAVPSAEECRDFFAVNAARIERVNELFHDELSQKTLKALLKAKLSWNLDYIKDVCVKNEYFPEDIIRLQRDEVFFDCGAWEGDTVEELLERTGGQLKKAVCFEPGEQQGQAFSRSFADDLRTGRIELIPKCLSDAVGTLYFENAEETTGSHVLAEGKDGCVSVPAITIDSIAQREPDVTFIKMDIEGSELAALRGAEQTIRRCRPKLAICVYHKREDIFEIPEYIHSLQLPYRYFLRHHERSLYETVFYAIPEEKVRI